MVLYIAQRSAGVLRSLPRTLAGIHTQVKRVSPVTNGVLANANVLPLGVRVGLLTTRSSYATSTSTGSGAKKTTGTTRKSSSTTASGTKKTTKSTATKKKTPVKKKTTTKKKAKKPAPKPKKKVLSEKQKKDREDKKQREQLKELKIQILAPPKKLADNQWAVGFQHKLTDALSANQKGAEAFRTATDLTRALSEEEKERFASIAENNKAANKLNYDRWLKSHTPLQIKEANLARRRLSKKTGKNLRQIDDDRLVKRPRTSYLIFLTERTSHGDFKHMAVKDIAVRVAEEWKGLTSSEKEKYQHLQSVDRERYLREYRETYGQEP